MGKVRLRAFNVFTLMCSTPFRSLTFGPQVRANMLGTAFSIYDGGVNPGKASDGAVRHELAAVEYAALAVTARN